MTAEGLWRRQSACAWFLFCLCMKYLAELLNGFAPNSQRRRVWSIPWTSLKVRGQRSRSWGTKNGILGLRRLPCGLCFVKHLQPLDFFEKKHACSIFAILPRFLAKSRLILSTRTGCGRNVFDWLYLLAKVQWNSFPKSRIHKLEERSFAVTRTCWLLWSWLWCMSAWCDCKSAPKEGEVTCRDTLFPVSDSVPHQSLRQHATHGVAKSQNSLGITAAAGRFRDHSMFSVLD